MLLADDSSSQLISTAFAVAAVVVAVITLVAMWVWRVRDRQSKMLDYLVISDTDIVRTHNRPEKLKVVYGPHEVNDPRVTEIRFKNTGKQVIETDDFIDPVEMKRPNSRILDYAVVEESANHLVDKIEIVMPQPDRPEHVRLFPRTLNSGDWFTVQLVYDGGGSSSDMEFTTRIKGETRKMAAFTPKSDVRRRRMQAWAAIVQFYLAGILIHDSVVKPANPFLVGLAIGFIALGLRTLAEIIGPSWRKRMTKMVPWKIISRTNGS